MRTLLAETRQTQGISNLVAKEVPPLSGIGRRIGPIGIIGLLLLAIVLPLWHIYLIRQPFPSSKNDLAAVWVGIRACWSRQNPYSDETTHTIQTMYYGRPLTSDDSKPGKMAFAYPAYIAFVLAPLAALSFAKARLLYDALAVLLMAGTVPAWLSFLQIKVSPARLAVLMVLTLTSWPMMWAFRVCQVTLVVAAMIAAGCWLMKRGHYAAAGVVLSCATIKPQLCIPLIAYLLIWSVLYRRWRFVTAMTLTVATLLASAECLQPGWFSGWLAALADYSLYTHSSPTLVYLCGAWAGYTLTAVLVGLISLTLWRGRTGDVGSIGFSSSLAMVLAATVCLTPTNMPLIYNQILLLPVFLLMLHLPASGRDAKLAAGVTLIVAFVGYALVGIAVIGELMWPGSLICKNLPFFNVLLPVCATIAFTLQLAELRPTTE
jgi:hypothetical protein